MTKFYEWDKTFSYQTGTNGEICIVTGAKGIGKTFGLRFRCIQKYLKKHETFCEICRTETELKEVISGYASKIQKEGYFTDYEFKNDSNNLYIRPKSAGEKNPHKWEFLAEFVSLTKFQTSKKRTYHKPTRIIFDEFIIDSKDRYHRYLPYEVLIFANLLDTITRQQPGDSYQYRVFCLGNAVDMTCPYLQFFGVDKIPGYGYHWYKNKTVLFHYVEPWDSEDRQAHTLVGRMLAGHEESKIIFDNIFEDKSKGEIAKKSSNARFAFALRWEKMNFGIWIDHKRGYFYVTSKVPKGSKATYALTKRDGTVNYQVIEKSHNTLQLLMKVFYIGGLRYETPHIRESFFEILSFIGVR